MKKKIKWIIIAIILAGISYLLYSMSKPAQVADPGMDSQAITFQATKETLVHTIRVKGKSLYEQETPVYAPFSSKITEWKIEDGQQVNKDDVLFRLDQTELQNQITREEAELRKAELETQLQSFVAEFDIETAGGELTEENRKKLLVNRESERMTKELEDVRQSIQRQELQQKKLKLQDSEFRAPAAGIFLFDSAAKKPQVLSDNQYVGKIVDLSKLQFTALVGEQDVFRIKPDMKVKVTMSAMKDVPLTGTVKHVSKFAKTGTDQDSLNKAAQFEVTISLEPSEYLIAGLSLTGDIETNRKENVLVLPSIAVMRDETSAYVMLDKGSGQYERRDIKTGLETMDKTEVLEGLKEGDTVALQ
ncbi:efflux RND transporter periplasmic adaptor subunit [Paenibacillus bouchesdurhonensis]|uniref:efflux RND transporter periplasmic adaptor subunit n=1 Tax=Paenibacillus bouchesdurhonensis TaxID=1870990 RepID=UPI000DA619D5|nr:efflux RND transporter periplasmic adaptor subunit [Paenibacillus bouchesdurhonensis]